MQRRIRSYVLRAGRVSKRQQLALEQWAKNYELPQTGALWNLEEIFNRNAKTVVEIGFGMGSSLFEMAKQHPELNFIGVEVHRPGVGSLVADLHEFEVTNVRIAAFDAVEVFKQHLALGSLYGVQIFFPDPWPKKKHHKRRLVQPEFMSVVSGAIQTDGFLHCATDWEEYAVHMLEVLEAEPSLKNTANGVGFVPRPDSRPKTKFEKRGQRLGHGVWDLFFKKI